MNPPILFWEINNLFILCCYKISSSTYTYPHYVQVYFFDKF
nr:MAG TPA: hypothetical protein [Caudoviricetes sp.]